ncbi:TPR domain-containing protein [Arthroderma uncinatum]|uniref:TPR domain-containing protein n=1 Tax=Arthroderma uncinatum TaxID=74035 RepID=UPI00144A777A|nr:TPR domain-containing protein [Arthroderma uncinatum]KAF3482669.1 TPR domain-containing protein [Arthroderma uncinatum]
MATSGDSASVPVPVPETYDTLFTATADGQRSYDSLRPTEAECTALLTHPFAQTVLGHDITTEGESIISSVTRGEKSFTSLISHNISSILAASTDLSRDRSRLIHLGHAALCAFLQANVTGPPLSFRAHEVVIPSTLRESPQTLRKVRDEVIRELSVNGEAVYKLTPNVELFAAAKAIFTNDRVVGDSNGEGALVGLTGRMRVNFLHQKMLNESADSLQGSIYDDVDAIGAIVLSDTPGQESNHDQLKERRAEKVRFMLERAVIHTHHGFDSKARADLLKAASTNGFEFALTGKLGRRTKFQDRDISQLVVLAKSASDGDEKDNVPDSKVDVEPKNLDLNDDTLLESIAFKKDEGEDGFKQVSVQDQSSLPASLAKLDAANQPRLNPLDSIMLLSLASAITNTSPEDGLTREETIPYAIRVLEGGSSNWQVYSQALLVRSRIEGYRSRTVERSVLQLQALVDQVIADTASDTPTTASEADTAAVEQPTTFLPRPEASESAPAAERLEYLWLLNFSTRWHLESELAQRWVSLGALRTALDIYERLQMWAEAALCYAATDREETAKMIVRKQLYERTKPATSADEDHNDTFEGPELSPLPSDAPRLFCILGDIDHDAAMYERAWVVSNKRYARAQRSLARLYMQEKPPNFIKAEQAYKLSLTVTRLNHATWFALGCIQIELEKWEEAIDSFTRTVQLEETDAEAWSNLAVALLNAPPRSTPVINDIPRAKALDDEEEEEKKNENANVDGDKVDVYKQKRDALAALHRAARFKHTSHRIWDNILTVSSSIPPPSTPFRDVLLAQTRIIELRGDKDGEKCIDISILTALVRTLTTPREGSSISVKFDPSVIRTGSLHGRLLRLFDDHIIPLITHSPELWLLVAEIEKWRGRPSKALAAHEKAWRAAISSCSQGAYQMGEESKWNEIVTATETLVRKGYAVYGGMDKEIEDSSEQGEEGGELVAKDWRFKSRSAVRGILGKGKQFWDGNEGWVRLDDLLREVSGS